MNKPKARGTAAETAVVKYVRENGFPWAERLTLTGHHDRGDISLLPGHLVVLEVKNHATAATGQPSTGQLAAWMAETEAERVNAGAHFAALVVKRKGTTDPGKWFAYVTAGDVLELAGVNEQMLPDVYEPVCVTFAALTRLYRHAGYGTPLETPTTKED